MGINYFHIIYCEILKYFLCNNHQGFSAFASHLRQLVRLAVAIFYFPIWKFFWAEELPRLAVSEPRGVEWSWGSYLGTGGHTMGCQHLHGWNYHGQCCSMTASEGQLFSKSVSVCRLEQFWESIWY